MLQTELPTTRSLTLVLSESEWLALREIEPDAVGWLQRQIQSRLNDREPPRSLEIAEEDY